MSLITALKSLFGMKPKALTLEAGDRLLECEDCHNEFVFDAGEQAFFKAKGFTDPKRCPNCRKSVKFRLRRRRRGNGGGGGGGGHHQNNSHGGGHGRRDRQHRRSASPYADQ